jgi:hypothetical protein
MSRAVAALKLPFTLNYFKIIVIRLLVIVMLSYYICTDMSGRFKYIIYILSFYFMAFSAMPQDYSFAGELLSSIWELSLDDTCEMECESEKEDDENKPPTLVEEDMHTCSILSFNKLSAAESKYGLHNEKCKGIRPGIILPPPDLFFA